MLFQVMPFASIVLDCRNTFLMHKKGVLNVYE